MTHEPARYRRKRSRVACEPCRERKRRCNGQVPCSTCTSWGYDCYYHQPPSQRHTRNTVVSDIAATPHPISGSIEPTLRAQNAPVAEVITPGPNAGPLAEPLEANSGAAFARKIGLKVDPANAPKLNLFGWNIGTRQLPSGLGGVSSMPIVDVISAGDMRALANVYFAKIDPCYGFIDCSVFFERLEARWSASAAADPYDGVLAGVAALGLLFSERSVRITEVCLVELARSILDSSLGREPPSLDVLTAWTLRVTYLRMTSPPYPAWIASSTLMHLIEASNLQRGSAELQGDPHTQRRLIGVAQHLNVWISYDLGLSRVSLPVTSESLAIPPSRPGDYTLELLNLLPVTTSLSPENQQSDKVLEASLLQTLGSSHTEPPSVLAQCNLVLCITRRLRMTNLTASPETMDRILALFRRGLDGARAMLASCSPWHHVANVPFQIIAVLLEMDTSAALALLPEAMQTVRLVSSTYDTETMREAYSTSRLLILLYQRRRSNDTRLLSGLLEDEHNHETSAAATAAAAAAVAAAAPPRLAIPSSGEVSWLEGLVADVPTLQGVDLYEFIQTDLHLSHESGY